MKSGCCKKVATISEEIFHTRNFGILTTMPFSIRESKRESGNRSSGRRLNPGLRSGIDIKAFWRIMSPGEKVFPASLHTCPFCGNCSATISPKLNRDWFFDCFSCGENWNLVAHIKKVSGFSSEDANKWLTSNAIVGFREIRTYSSYSDRIRRIYEIIRRGRMESPGIQMQHYAPGEIVPLSPSLAASLLSLLKVGSGVFDSKHLYLMLFRDITGSISRINIHSSTNRVGCLSFTILDSMYHMFCPDRLGFKSSGSISIISSVSAGKINIEQIPDRRSILIEPYRKARDSRFEVPGEWTWFYNRITIFSHPETLNHDIQSFGALMNFFDVKVSIMDDNDNVSTSTMMDTVAQSRLFPNIVGHLLSRRWINQDTLEALEQKRGGQAASGIALGLEAIKNAERKKPLMMLPKTRRPYGNFKIVCYYAGNGTVSVCVNFDEGGAMNIEVPEHTFEDSNLLYQEITKAAIQNNLPFPVVHKKPPYPKKLFQ